MPTMFIIGDSTVDNFHAPFRGWGWAMPEHAAPGVQVCNHAISGRSSRSFYDEGRFAPVCDALQPGDLLLIQFGHNDEKDDPARHTDADSSYQDFLRLYCRAALDKGALPVLVTPVSRRAYSGTFLLYSHAAYPYAAKLVARELGIPCLDLEMASRRLFLSLGMEETARLFVHIEPGENPDYPNGHDDCTHFNAQGARAMAGLVADMMRQEPRLLPYLKA